MLSSESPAPSSVPMLTSCGSPDPSWPLHSGSPRMKGGAGKESLVSTSGMNEPDTVSEDSSSSGDSLYSLYRSSHREGEERGLSRECCSGLGVRVGVPSILPVTGFLRSQFFFGGGTKA